MNVGIVGSGLVGNKRAQVLKNIPDDKLLLVADIDESRARKLTSKHAGCRATSNWKLVINDPKIESVIVATTHDLLAPISLAALRAGKNVLCEKPLGISAKDVKKCVNLSDKRGLIYKAGYNHRFHPVIKKTHDLFERGKIGKLMYINATYGHGGRPGYEKEWRANKKKSGGGELIDQGAHLIDLACWFMGSGFDKVSAQLTTSFWPIKPLEDNVFLLLKNELGVAQIHASWTLWKNKFTFDIFGTTGYLKADGLGGSYGKETLVFGKRVPGKVPREKIWKFPDKDVSWSSEWLNFRKAILRKEELMSSGRDGLAVLEIIEKIYKAG